MVATFAHCARKYDLYVKIIFIDSTKSVRYVGNNSNISKNNFVELWPKSHNAQTGSTYIFSQFLKLCLLVTQIPNAVAFIRFCVFSKSLSYSY